MKISTLRMFCTGEGRVRVRGQSVFSVFFLSISISLSDACSCRVDWRTGRWATNDPLRPTWTWLVWMWRRRR